MKLSKWNTLQPTSAARCLALSPSLCLCVPHMLPWHGQVPGSLSQSLPVCSSHDVAVAWPGCGAVISAEPGTFQMRLVLGVWYSWARSPTPLSFSPRFSCSPFSLFSFSFSFSFRVRLLLYPFYCLCFFSSSVLPLCSYFAFQLRSLSCPPDKRQQSSHTLTHTLSLSLSLSFSLFLSLSLIFSLSHFLSLTSAPS